MIGIGPGSGPGRFTGSFSGFLSDGGTMIGIGPGPGKLPGRGSTLGASFGSSWNGSGPQLGGGFNGVFDGSFGRLSDGGTTSGIGPGPGGPGLAFGGSGGMFTMLGGFLSVELPPKPMLGLAYGEGGPTSVAILPPLPLDELPLLSESGFCANAMLPVITIVSIPAKIMKIPLMDLLVIFHLLILKEKARTLFTGLYKAASDIDVTLSSGCTFPGKYAFIAKAGSARAGRW
jgi:hypothetical protein